jgi:hypothetical protein
VKTTCDSQGFIQFSKQAEDVRKSRLLSEAEFANPQEEEGIIVLAAHGDGSHEYLRVREREKSNYTPFFGKALCE